MTPFSGVTDVDMLKKDGLGKAGRADMGARGARRKTIFGRMLS